MRTAAITTLIIASLAPQTTEAQDSLAGTWQLATSSQRDVARRTSIEAATEDMGRFMRRRVRERLTERTTPIGQIRIAFSGRQVRLSGRRSITLVVGGPAVEVEGERGRGTLRATRRGERLVVSMRGDNGRQTTTYQLAEDGRLIVDVEMSGERLSDPIRYRLVYRRARPGS